MAKKKKTLEQKYVELLEAQVELLERTVAEQNAKIKTYEQDQYTISYPGYVPYQPQYPSIPSVWPVQPPQCQHTYPTMWGGSGLPACTKCGAVGVTSGTIITTGSGTSVQVGSPTGQGQVSTPAHATFGGSMLGVDLSGLATNGSQQKSDANQQPV